MPVSERLGENLAGRLPPDLRSAWACLEADALDLLGRIRPINALIARHYETLEALVQGGLRYADLATMMAEAGITRADGQYISVNTIAVSLRRARREPDKSAPRYQFGVKRSRAPTQVSPTISEPMGSPINHIPRAGPEPPVSPSARLRHEASSVNPASHADENRRMAELLIELGDAHD